MITGVKPIIYVVKYSRIKPIMYVAKKQLTPEEDRFWGGVKPINSGKLALLGERNIL